MKLLTFHDDLFCQEVERRMHSRQQTPHDITRATGVPYATIYRMVTKHRVLSHETIINVADAYRIDLKQFTDRRAQ